MFIKNLIKKLEIDNNNYIILDNARIHHYKKIKEFINTKEKIKLIYNVPYSPKTNPIECVFNDIKKYLTKEKINNHNLKIKIEKSLNNTNSNNFKAYYKKSLIDEINKIGI